MTRPRLKNTPPKWDSLQAMNLVVALEEPLMHAFTKEILSMRTVGLVRKVLRDNGVAGAKQPHKSEA